MPDAIDDPVLISATQGDQEAFGALYERYVGKIFNYVYYRTGSVAEAEDLTARVFFKAHKHIRHFKDIGVPFSAWLYRIAHNLVANWYRDTSRKKEVPLDDSVPIHPRVEQPESLIINHQELEGLLRRIRRLSSDRQQLIILKFVEGYSNAEIGVIMGRSEGAVKSLYHRTLLALRDEFEDDSGGDTAVSV
ncbi:MAG TPA: sigma-70 family RNA polymerase sigma factor [Anaerolineaceae bacterium]|nr:sigma-70 family RNA polymerase sigma factor [Anaerolineaceae bacterium]